MKRKYYLIRIFIILLLIEITYIIYFKNQNQVPITFPDEIKTYTGYSTELSVLKNDIDNDGDTLLIDSIVEPRMGNIINMGKYIKYTPNDEFEGIDSLKYSVSDGKDVSNFSLVTINVVKEVNLYIEAESFNKEFEYKPFLVVDDNEASNKKYITTPKEIENSYYSVPEEGCLTYFIDIKDDVDLKIWFKVKGRGAGFWIFINDEKPLDCYFYSDPRAWIWKNSGISYNFTRGKHKIELYRSESNDNLDMILLTNFEKPPN